MASTPAPTPAAPAPTVLTPAQTSPAPNFVAPQAAPPPAPAAAPTPTSSLFHKILGVGLASLALSMVGEGTAGPGEAAAKSFETGIGVRQQAVQNTQAQERLQQGQQSLGIEQQKVNLGQQQLAEQTKLDQANIGLAHANILKTMREVSLLPADRQQYLEEQFGLPAANALVKAGAQIVGGDYDTFQDAFAQAVQVQGATHNLAVFAAPIAGSQDADGNFKYGVYELPTGILQTPLTFQMGDQTISIPAGTLRSQAGAIIADGVSRAFAQTTAIDVAKIGASSRESVAQTNAASAAYVQGLRNQSPQQVQAAYATVTREVDSLNTQIGAAQQRLNSFGSLMSPERDAINQQIADLQNQLAAAQVRQALTYSVMRSQDGAPPATAHGTTKVGDVVNVGKQRVRVTRVNPDGTYTGVPVGGQ